MSVKDEFERVKFWDFDGALIADYSLEEAQALEYLPSVPKHPGLEFQGWNWRLGEVRNVDHGIDVGAVYSPVGGDTQLKIVIDEGQETVPIFLSLPTRPTRYNNIRIDWGDGARSWIKEDDFEQFYNEDYLGSATHTYRCPTYPMEYTIRINTDDGTNFYLGAASSYTGGFWAFNAHVKPLFNQSMTTRNGSLLRAVHFGVNGGFSYHSIVHQQTVLMGCCLCEAITFPEYNEIVRIELDNAEMQLPLKSVIYPRSTMDRPSGVGFTGICVRQSFYTSPQYNACPKAVLSLPSAQPEAYYDFSWNIVRICSSPFGRIVMPRAVRGDTASFYSCSHNTELEYLWIGDGWKMPQNVSDAFAYCPNLKAVRLPPTTTAICPYGFRNDYALQRMNLVDTRVATIGNYAFLGCISLSQVRFPKTLRSIGANAFDGCQNCRLYDFREAEQIPTATDTSFLGIAGGVRILVPLALYAEWREAWPTWADYIVGG